LRTLETQRSTRDRGRYKKQSFEQVCSFLTKYQEMLRNPIALSTQQHKLTDHLPLCELDKSLTDLLRAKVCGPRLQWFQKVQLQFVSHLDNAARQLTINRCKSVALKVAVCPKGRMDSVIVLTHSWLLVRDICQIYGLRPNAIETTWIAVSIARNSLISVGANEVGDKISDQLSGWVDDYIGSLGGKFFGKFTGLSAEAVLNGRLLYRLGEQTRKVVSPLCE
jgi:hypothetical protein